MTDISVHIADVSPSKALSLAIQAAFIVKGTSLTKWCSENRHPNGKKIHESNATQALRGSWTGKSADAFRNRMIQESKLEVVSNEH